MEALVGLPFNVLEIPNLKIKKPSWVKPPSAMFVFALVLLSYFLVTGGKCLKLYFLLSKVGKIFSENLYVYVAFI